MLYDLGYVLQLQGATDSAVASYREAIAQRPQHAFAHYNLGTLLQAKGDAAGAASLYRKAIALDRGHRPGLDARQRLAALAPSAADRAPWRDRNARSTGNALDKSSKA